MQAQKPFEYTLNMETIFQGKLSELKSYYCREDFELALADYDHAPKDAKSFRLRDVSRLCNARGIDAKTLIADRSILKSIPTRLEMQDELLQSFYDMYSKSPATSDFMERIVRRLAPEYTSDTVRVAILKKFVVGAGDNFKRFHTNQIWEWAKKQLSKAEIATYGTLPEEEKQSLLLSKINDSIFEHESVEMTNIDVLKLIIDRITKYQNDDTLAFEEIELSERTRGLLAGMLSVDENDINKDVINCLQMICDRMDASEEAFSELVSSLENDFRNQLKTIKRVSKTGKEGTAAELYKQAKKDALKAKKAAAKKNDIDFELIEMCNDLAAGNFRVNGKTKVYLYYFAFMFDMTVPLDGRDCAPERNIVKNLFQDFYNDNFLRLLSSDYTDPKNATAFEKEPTGEGINYKSFVEMIYIYFLCRDDLNMTQGEKIDKAEAVIDECVKRAKKAGKLSMINTGIHTDVYRDMHVNVLLNKEIDEIADYILAHYQVYSPDNNGIARIMVASEENTAFDLITEIMDDIDGTRTDIDLFDIRQKSSLTREIKADIAFDLDAEFDWEVKNLLEEKFSDDAAFLKVLNEIDKRTHISNGRFNKNDRTRMLTLLHVLAIFSSKSTTLSMYKLQSRLEEMGVVSVGHQIANAIKCLIDIGFDICKDKDDYYLGEREYNDELLMRILGEASKRSGYINSESEILMIDALISRLTYDKRVTRSEMIAVHFNYYIALLDQMEVVDEEYKKETGKNRLIPVLESFDELYSDYEFSINQYLEDARYQPLSMKNIFDSYVVFALYFYLMEDN